MHTEQIKFGISVVCGCFSTSKLLKISPQQWIKEIKRAICKDNLWTRWASMSLWPLPCLFWQIYNSECIYHPLACVVSLSESTHRLFFSYHGQRTESLHILSKLPSYELFLSGISDHVCWHILMSTKLTEILIHKRVDPVLQTIHHCRICYQIRIYISVCLLYNINLVKVHNLSTICSFLSVWHELSKSERSRCLFVVGI